MKSYTSKKPFEHTLFIADLHFFACCVRERIKESKRRRQKRAEFINDIESRMCDLIVALTVDLSGGQLSVEQFQVRDAVQDVQEGLGEPQEVAEAVEPEVDELPGQLDHLEGELVLLRVAESPHVVDDVLEVGLDEDDGRVEARANHLLGRVRCLVGVVAENNIRNIN